MTILEDVFDLLLGFGEQAHELTTGQMAVRAVIIYGFALLLIRVGDKRFLGKNTAFDIILAIILGSILSRAVTGSSAFLPTLGAAAVLVGVHWASAFIAFRSDRFGSLIKGHRRELVIDGELQEPVAAKSHITRADLEQALRLNGGVDDVTSVRRAYLERNGDISVISDS